LILPLFQIENLRNLALSGLQNYSKRLIIDICLLVIASVAVIDLNSVFPFYAYAFRYIDALFVLGAGIILSREVALFVSQALRPRFERNALVVGNILSATGYTLSALAALSFATVSATVFLAASAFGGLVFGLALQPTLGSFFAGLLILFTGTVRAGTQVRILSWHIPFQWAFNPGYKYFSPDAVYAGYLSEVVSVGLFFTSVVTEEGQLMRIPNTILATDAAIVSYTERDYIFNVRYEFPIRFDPDEVLKRVSNATKGFPVMSTIVNEQSDKQYYIVKIVLNARERDHAVMKSQILTKIIMIHKQMEAESK
jgi:small-conductance mechanosensitive channel